MLGAPHLKASVRLAPHAEVASKTHSWDLGLLEHADAHPLPAVDDTPVASIMTAKVVCFPTHMPVQDVAALLLDRGISGGPVVDAAGHPIGVISKTDVLSALHYAEDDSDEPVLIGDVMVPYILAISYRSPISLAAALMAYEGVHRLLVLDDAKVMVGIVSVLDVLRWLAQLSGFCLPHTTQRQRSRVAAAEGAQHPHERAARNTDGGHAHADSANKLSAAGKPSKAELLRGQAEVTSISTIMSRNVVCLAPEASVQSVAETFLNGDIGGAPVVDDGWRCLGMLSKIDLLRAFSQDGTPECIGDVPLGCALSVTEEAPVAVVAALMAYEGVHRLPVVSAASGEVTGVVSTLDTIRWVARAADLGIDAAAAVGPDL